MKSLIFGGGILLITSVCCLEAAPMSRAGFARVVPRSPAIARVTQPAAPMRQAAVNSFGRMPASLASPRSQFAPGFGRFHDRDRFTENGRHEHFRDRDRAFFITSFVVGLGWPYWNYWYWPYWSSYDDPNDYSLEDPNNHYQVAIIPEARKQSQSQEASDHQPDNQLYASLLAALARQAVAPRPAAAGFPQSNWSGPGAYPQSLTQNRQSSEERAQPNASSLPSLRPGTAPSEETSRTPADTMSKAVPVQRSDNLPKRVLLSWFKEGGKEVALVEDTELKRVERVTTQPNSDHLRIVEVHSDINPQLSEVVISDGQKQETVRFAPL
jgi:hypothetical protein